MEKYLKYFNFFVLWCLFFFLLMALENGSFLIKEWALMSRLHFEFYVLVGGVFAGFYWVDDNWKIG